MAVTTVTSGLDQVKGIKYTVITDSSSDWPSVGNDVYFYDKATSLPYYKNASGTVVSIFEEGGVSSNVYTADGIIGAGRVATLTDTLRFKDGILQVEGANTSSTNSALQIYDGDGTPNLLWDFRNNSDVVLNQNANFVGSSATNFYKLSIFRPINAANYGAYYGVDLYNSSNVQTEYARFGANIVTNTSGAEYGRAKVSIMKNGTVTSLAEFDSVDGLSILANTTTNLFKAGSVLTVSTSSVTAKSPGVTGTPLTLFRDVGANNYGVNLDLALKNSSNAQTIYGKINVKIIDYTAGSEDSELSLRIMDGGTLTTKITIKDDSTLISEKLELSTTDDGFLMPRLTTAQKNAISSPVDTNLMLFDTDLNSLQRYNGSAWVNVAAGVGIVQLTQEGGSGGSVFYTDVQSALTAANSSGGDITITLHDNITTTAVISTNVTTNIDNIIFDLNGFTITNTANDSSAVIFNKLQSNIITIINGSIIKTTGTGNALHFSSGIGDLYMSNCYVYSEAGSALKIDASVTPINIWELGNSTFKTNTGYGVYLADALGGVSLTNFISISTGSGMACFLNAGGDVTNFKAIAEGTGTALRVRSAVTSVTDFYAESNSGSCVLLESLTPMVKDFTAISISGYAVYSLSSAYKIENFYCKTTSGTHSLYVPANSILINGDVFSDSTLCAFISNAERVENVNFTTNSGTYAVQSRFTTSWINCTFRNKDGIAFYNYGSSTSKFKKCTFISEKTSGGTAHAANILDGTSVVTFVNCDFEVADSTVNCIKANASMNMKVANCSFDNSTTPLSSNITLNYLETDAYGNVTT